MKHSCAIALPWMTLPGSKHIVMVDRSQQTRRWPLFESPRRRVMKNCNNNTSHPESFGNQSLAIRDHSRSTRKQQGASAPAAFFALAGVPISVKEALQQSASRLIICLSNSIGGTSPGVFFIAMELPALSENQ